MTPRSSTESQDAAASDAAPVADAPAGGPIPAPHPSAAIVDTWFSTHFHNMPAHFSERAYALIYGAKEELKALLAKL